MLIAFLNNSFQILQRRDILYAEPTGGVFSIDGVVVSQFFGPDPGIYTIQYGVTDNSGCSSSEEFININVVSGPKVNVNYPDLLCGLTIPFMRIPDTPGEIFSGNVNAINEFIPTQIGLNELVYSYENSQDCRTNFNFSIEVLESTDPQITNVPNALCFSQSDVYQFIAEPAGGVFTGNVNASGEFIPNKLGVNSISNGPGSRNNCISAVTFDVEVVPEEIVLVDRSYYS